MNAYFVDGGDCIDWEHMGEGISIPHPGRACDVYVAETRGSAKWQCALDYDLEFTSKFSVRLLAKDVDLPAGRVRGSSARRGPDKGYHWLWHLVGIVVDKQTTCPLCEGEGCKACWETGYVIPPEELARAETRCEQCGDSGWTGLCPLCTEALGSDRQAV